MNTIDIVLALPLLWALYNGYRKGIISQIGGIVGLIIGVFVAYYLGGAAYEWLNVTSPAGRIVTFVILVGLTLFCVSIAARILSGAFRTIGIGWLDHIGGALLGLLKWALILSILLLGFEWINDRKQLVTVDKLNNSLLYNPVLKVSDYAFPYAKELKEKITDWVDPEGDAEETEPADE